MLKFNCVVPRVFLKLNKVPFGKKLRLIGWPFIFRFPRAKLTIGDNVQINSNFWSNLLGLYQRTIIIARGEGVVKIGDRVGMSGATIYAHDRIEIGNDCFIGANVKIIDNDFHPIDPIERKTPGTDIPHKPDDFEFATRVYLAGKKICTPDEVISNFNFGGMSTKKNFKETMKRVELSYGIYKKHGMSRFHWFHRFAMEMAKYILG